MDEFVQKCSQRTTVLCFICNRKQLNNCKVLNQIFFVSFGRFDREAAEDVTIGGITIPKHTLVVVPVWAIHRDSELWPSPDTFDPERLVAASDIFLLNPFAK